MSVFHCTLAVHHEKSLVPEFFKVPVNHLFANVHCNDSGKINYCCGKKLNFRSKPVKLKLIVNQSICSVTYLKVFHKILA